MDEEKRKPPIILLIEEDDETRPLLRRNLQKDGYRLLLAVDEEDALDRLGGDVQVRANLILINLVGKTPDEVLRIGQRIREHGKYDSTTPLVVIAEKYGEDVEGTDVNVGDNDWITYPEDAGQLHRLLARLTTPPR
jgi:PleD family two-component response regulator